MFDIAKAVERTKKGKDKQVKEIIKKIEQGIKEQASIGKTNIFASVGKNENEIKRIMKYFENRGFIVSNHNSDIIISWDYMED